MDNTMNEAQLKKVDAEIAKLMAETAKLNRETLLYPVIVTATACGALVALTKLLF